MKLILTHWTTMKFFNIVNHNLFLLASWSAPRLGKGFPFSPPLIPSEGMLLNHNHVKKKNLTYLNIYYSAAHVRIDVVIPYTHLNRPHRASNQSPRNCQSVSFLTVYKYNFIPVLIECYLVLSLEYEYQHLNIVYPLLTCFGSAIRTHDRCTFNLNLRNYWTGFDQTCACGCVCVYLATCCTYFLTESEYKNK